MKPWDDVSGALYVEPRTSVDTLLALRNMSVVPWSCLSERAATSYTLALGVRDIEGDLPVLPYVLHDITVADVDDFPYGYRDATLKETLWVLFACNTEIPVDCRIVCAGSRLTTHAPAVVWYTSVEELEQDCRRKQLPTFKPGLMHYPRAGAGVGCGTTTQDSWYISPGGEVKLVVKQ